MFSQFTVTLALYLLTIKSKKNKNTISEINKENNVFQFPKKNTSNSSFTLNY